MADCTDCGHCAELYTPKESDSTNLKEVRNTVINWINDILKTPTEKADEFIQWMYLQIQESL